MSEQRLIDAKEASDIIWKRSEEMRDSEPALSGALAAAIGFLNKCKTVPAEVIVHCRDCKYYQDNNGGYPNSDCRWRQDETPDADDFCSCGERRESEAGR